MKTIRLLTLQRNDDDNTNTTPIKETFLIVENSSLHIFGPESMKNGK